MAGSSVIGALRVDLGLNSAQFASGLKGASRTLNKFGIQLTLGLETIANGIGRALGAVPQAIKGAIDHADELGKTAQKIGLSVEALSRLEYAAKLSDVSLEGLSTGVRKLSQNMAAIASGTKGGAATALASLGIAVTDASGRLRSGDQVFADVADRFSRMENGALKTSLAVQIFGKSGADLIPLLNSGRDGLANMANEADRLGLTISGKTAAAAEVFNDTLTRISAIMQGVVNQVMAAALPALQDLANTLASPEFAAAAQSLAIGVTTALNEIILMARDVINVMGEVGKAIDMLPDINPLAMFTGSNVSEEVLRRLKDAPKVKAAMAGQARDNAMPGALDSLRTSLGSGSFNVPSQGFYSGIFGGGSANPFEPITTNAGGAKKSLTELTDLAKGFTDSSKEMASAVGDTLAGAFSGFFQAIRSGTAPLEALSNQLGNIADQLLNSAISSFFGNLFGGGFNFGGGLGGGNVGRGVYGGGGGFFPGFPGFANGTNFAPGGMAWVGERGPELVNLPRGSQVIPNHELGGGGRLDVHVTAEVVNGNLVPVMTQVAGHVAGKVVQQQAPIAVANANRNRQR